MTTELNEIDSDLMILAIQEQLRLLDGNSYLSPKEKAFALIKLHDGWNISDTVDFLYKWRRGQNIDDRLNTLHERRRKAWI